ncbi:MBL fold metallo-hydrolase [Candidatus Woesearchaeota archaeon]|nr:MBL fold metallo-hydrolase [Candidatus Woesearchaeota archaeon]
MVEIKRLGHATFKIHGSKIIYIDPWKLSQNDKADIILISHGHYDHLSKDDIAKIRHEKTWVIAAKDIADDVNARGIAPGQKIEANGVKIEGVPAYNINKKFHLKENKWLGFVIEIDGKRIYYAGDTDNIPEMADLKNIDIALMPVSGTYVMTAEEAAEAVKKFRPKQAIPYHYGDIIGTKDDAARFKKLCSCEVLII